MNSKEYADFMIENRKAFDDAKKRLNDATTEEEVNKIQDEMNKIQARANQAIGERKALLKSEQLDFSIDHEEEANEIEQRASDLIAGKTVKMGMGQVFARMSKTTDTGIVMPKNYDNNIREQLFPTVSSIYDRFTFLNVDGGESITIPFDKSKAEAGVTAEGAAYHEITGNFDYVTIGRKKITAYFEVSEEFEKLPKANYEAILRNELQKALKRKIISLAINDDETNGFTGILSSTTQALKVCPADKDMEVAALDKFLLRRIQFNYGYADEIADVETLALNKKDIGTLALIEGKNKEYAYDYSAERRTLDNVPFVTPSAIPAFTNASAALFGFYGDLSTYTIAIYSPVEIAKSTDVGFKNGMIAYRASVILGGAPTALCGLMRLKSKKASA